MCLGVKKIITEPKMHLHFLFKNCNCLTDVNKASIFYISTVAILEFDAVLICGG